MSRIALVSSERQITIVEPDGRSSQLTGGVDPMMWANWSDASATKTAHTWPCFSPDGARLACFRLRSGQDSAVLVSSLDGVSSAEVIDLADQLPIYLQWSIDGSKIAAVSQSSQDLLLTVGSPEAVSAQRILAKGSPLFITWTFDGRLATFIGGGSPNARMMILDPGMRKPTEILAGTPGDFCAPVAAHDGLLYAAHERGQASIMFQPESGPVRSLPGGKGLLAFVASPDGKTIARAVAPGGDGSPYRDLTIVDIATGTERRIADMTCLAFQWAPDGSGLVVARVDTDRGVVEWFFVDTHGTSRHLGDLVPSRDMRFYLRFFEQYSASHPIVDPDSRFLVLAGVLRGHVGGGRVWRVPLRGGRPEEVAEGQFATFSPPIAN